MLFIIAVHRDISVQVVVVIMVLLLMMMYMNGCVRMRVMVCDALRWWWCVVIYTVAQYASSGIYVRNGVSGMRVCVCVCMCMCVCMCVCVWVRVRVGGSSGDDGVVRCIAVVLLLRKVLLRI